MKTLRINSSFGMDVRNLALNTGSDLRNILHIGFKMSIMALEKVLGTGFIYHTLAEAFF